MFIAEMIQFCLSEHKAVIIEDAQGYAMVIMNICCTSVEKHSELC